MGDFVSLANQFLVSMPAMEDPNFSQSVTLICFHDREGAMGITINRPTNIVVGDVLRQMEAGGFPSSLEKKVVFSGGPLQPDRGLVLHEEPGEWLHTREINERLCLTTSEDILQAVARRSGPGNYLVALGYAGWAGGQLEHELMHNAWLTTPMDHDLMFHAPLKDRWKMAARLTGVDPERLSSVTGYA